MVSTVGAVRVGCVRVLASLSPPRFLDGSGTGIIPPTTAGAPGWVRPELGNNSINHMGPAARARVPIVFRNSVRDPQKALRGARKQRLRRGKTDRTWEKVHTHRRRSGLPPSQALLAMPLPLQNQVQLRTQRSHRHATRRRPGHGTQENSAAGNCTALSVSLLCVLCA